MFRKAARAVNKVCCCFGGKVGGGKVPHIIVKADFLQFFFVPSTVSGANSLSKILIMGRKGWRVDNEELQKAS